MHGTADTDDAAPVLQSSGPLGRAAETEEIVSTTSRPPGSSAATGDGGVEAQDVAPAASGGFHRAGSYGLTLFKKFNNDTSMNLVAMVSFNVMTSVVPLILALVTLVAVLPVVSNNVPQIAAQINRILPANLAKDANVARLLTSIHGASMLLTLVSIAGCLWGGMNLFSSIESAFAFIYRVKTRDILPQKVMSLVMILLFALLLPLSFVASIVLGAGTTSLGKILPSDLSGPFTATFGFATALLALFMLFAAIYTVVPNRAVAWRSSWRGALCSAVAMTVVNTAFPVYTAHFIGSREYSTAAIATAIITITWFWFFSLILLVGAQINALSMGIGPWKYDITRILMEHAAAHGENVLPPSPRRHRHHRFLIFSGIARDSDKVASHGERGTTAPRDDSA